jgi:prolyl-tRNA editing enzyme YbaK/EbsC (Cys-tRNA(Pro) deacylase)
MLTRRLVFLSEFLPFQCTHFYFLIDQGMSVNIHLKALAFQSRFFGSGKSEAAIYHHSIEDRIAAVQLRFDVLEKKLATPATKVPKAIKNLEPCDQDTPEVAKLRLACKTIPLHTAVFKWVSSEYYEKPLTWRREQLGAPSIRYLCKSIVLENTHCKFEDCADPTNSRFYIAVFQYVERFDTEKVLRLVKDMNSGLGKKQFNYRLANPEASQKMTGFGYNAVVPFGTTDRIPVILSEKIAALSPAFFWMGGGHVDCKVRVDTEEFLNVVKPFVGDITTPIPEEELASISGY